MPYNGTGLYSLPAPAYPAIPGTTILAESRNEIDEDIASGLNNAFTRDGQTVATGNWRLGDFSISHIRSLTGGVAGLTLYGNVYGTTLPNGTSDKRLATTEFVAAQVFTATLPGQAGNEGKVLTTDGVSASWQTLPIPDFLFQAQGIK